MLLELIGRRLEEEEGLRWNHGSMTKWGAMPAMSRLVSCHLTYTQMSSDALRSVYIPSSSYAQASSIHRHLIYR